MSILAWILIVLGIIVFTRGGTAIDHYRAGGFGCVLSVVGLMVTGIGVLILVVNK